MNQKRKIYFQIRPIFFEENTSQIRLNRFDEFPSERPRVPSRGVIQKDYTLIFLKIHIYLKLPFSKIF